MLAWLRSVPAPSLPARDNPICDLALSPLYPELHRDVEELLAERGLDISYETALGAKVRPPDRATAAPASPWAERSLTIDHVLGAANYRSLRDDEPPMRPCIVGIQWI